MKTLARFAALLLAAAAASVFAAPVLAAPAAGDDGQALLQMLRDDARRHEHGDGVPRDPAFAAALYCRAAALDDAESAYHLGWMYAWGRGVERHDGWAAHFLELAAARGIAQAPALLRLVAAAPQLPDCLRPAPAPVAAASPTEPPADATARLEAQAPRRLVDLVKKMAPEYRVHPSLVLAVMKAESNFERTAVSPKNAQGLMQLIPETAARFNVRNPFDARQNLRGGMAYLRWLLAYFEGDLALVAAAYNAGEGAVERHGGVPPYRETRAYVQRIVEAFGGGVHPFDPSVTQPSPRLRQIRPR